MTFKNHISWIGPSKKYIHDLTEEIAKVYIKFYLTLKFIDRTQKSMSGTRESRI